MAGRSLTFGAVGAVSGIKNPILTAHRMVVEAEKGLLSLGRIPPMMIAGRGAKEWAKARGQVVVNDNELIEPKSYKTYLDHLQKLVEDQAVEDADLGHDTVGAICIDSNGDISAAVSSGGISLKVPGRVGEAAVYGSGCWAQNEKDGQAGVACSTTGTGEQIMRTMFTHKCIERLLKEDDIQTAVTNTLKKDFLDSPFLDIYDEKSVGTIALRTQTLENKTRIEFWYGHVTDDMGIGYMSGTSNNPKTFVSRKSSKSEAIVSSGRLIV
ncbi:unnamed protein product [Mucor hiemalis]